jgi:SAM-dependent methyltransferase
MPVPIHLLRCPETELPLHQAANGEFVTSGGERSYPSLGGVPVLLPLDNSLFSGTAVTGRGADSTANSRVKVAVKRLVPSASLALGSLERYEALARRLANDIGDTRTVLVVGGGRLGEGMEALVSDPSVVCVETDVYPSPRVDVVCDAHKLPFVDGAFDCVVVQAVLEHVASPPDVVQEIHRVLKPGALVYSETPFMQQVHEGPYDFTRFTDVGHRRLFRMFDELDRGVVCGPAMSLVWALRYFARAIPRRSRTASQVLDLAVTAVFFWLKYLDHWLADHPSARDGASGLYFLGRRRDKPLADSDILATYVGSVGSPFSGP